MSELKSFDQLPKYYKDAVNHIVERVLGDGSPCMNEAFQEWQAELYLADCFVGDMEPDLKLFEIEALAFRDGWERREQVLGVPL
ncbi:MAG: hypothetical protein HQ578_02420 [Chloroflexi bacterium]|nr:hypothetical protein [Chloroflexota bacterium]